MVLLKKLLQRAQHKSQSYQHRFWSCSSHAKVIMHTAFSVPVQSISTLCAISPTPIVATSPLTDLIYCTFTPEKVLTSFQNASSLQSSPIGFKENSPFPVCKSKVTSHWRKARFSGSCEIKSHHLIRLKDRLVGTRWKRMRENRSACQLVMKGSFRKSLCTVLGTKVLWRSRIRNRVLSLKKHLAKVLGNQERKSPISTEVPFRKNLCLGNAEKRSGPSVKVSSSSLVRRVHFWRKGRHGSAGRRRGSSL